MSQSFIKKPANGPHSPLGGLGVLASERRATDFPDRAPAGYVWAIAESESDRFCPSGYLRIRPEMGRFYLHSEARKSIKARADAHNMTLVPVLIENMPVVCEDDAGERA